MIHQTSIEYGLNETVFTSVLKCESGLNPNAVGDKGTSLGIAQIHIPAHASISPVQAFNPAWAIDWSGQQFAMGNAHIWSCYRILYG